MKKSLLLMALMLFAAGTLSAAETTKEFTRAQTTDVSVTGNFRVVLSDEYNDNVKIVYDDALSQYLVTEIKGKQLKVYYSRGAAKVMKSVNLAPATIYIARNFTNYQFEDGVTVSSTEDIEGGDLSIRLGDACFEANISANKLQLKTSDVSSFTGTISAREAMFAMSGSSTVNVAGVVGKLTINASGNSVLNAENLENQTSVKMTASGASSVAFVGKGAVKLSASGSATVWAKLNCKGLSVSAAGSSQVILSGVSKTLKLSATNTARVENKEYIAELSATFSTKGASSVAVCSRGAMKISASGTSTVNADTESSLTLKVSNSASVFHNPMAKLMKLTLKDQAIVKAIEKEKGATVNFFATPQSFNGNR